jgi:hypothetical protein
MNNDFKIVNMSPEELLANLNLIAQFLGDDQASSFVMGANIEFAETIEVQALSHSRLKLRVNLTVRGFDQARMLMASLLNNRGVILDCRDGGVMEPPD